MFLWGLIRKVRVHLTGALASTVCAVARYVRHETSARSVGVSVILTFWLIYSIPGVRQLPGAAGAGERTREKGAYGEKGVSVTFRM